MKLQEKIDSLFVQCSHSQGVATFYGILRILWPLLNNSVSLVDISGVYMVSSQDSSAGLDITQFSEFFQGIARVKYPFESDFCEKFLHDLQSAKSVKVWNDAPIFMKSMDKEVTRLFLSYDFLLRRIFCTYSGPSIKVGAGASWDEVKRLSIGMDIDGFTAFASSSSLLPNHLSAQQCVLMAKNVQSQFPLLSSGATLNSALLFPQFQLLLCYVAAERHDAAIKKSAATNATNNFAKKVVTSENRPMHELLKDLFRALGLERMSQNSSVRDGLGSPSGNRTQTLSATVQGDSYPTPGQTNAFSGTVVLPSSEQPEDLSSNMTHARQAMVMRIDQLFSDLEDKLKTPANMSRFPCSELESMLAPLVPGDHPMTPDQKKRNLLNKPVVIGDAIPIPNSSQCHESVEQMLQAALAHHNLGNFEESLKFLEASRVQLLELERKLLLKQKQEDAEEERQRQLAELVEDEEESEAKSAKALKDLMENQAEIVVLDSEVNLPLELDMYITMCKSNVYQSCGDDEQAIICSLNGWTRAATYIQADEGMISFTKEKGNKDWEIVCLNSLGLLAYYNLRYDVALRCFAKVASYRSEMYGNESADTATAWNNEASCLYCLLKKGEARVRFERSWNVLTGSLGHRHPRAVAIWRNLDKARRSQAAVQTQKDMQESLSLREDSDKLLLGGEYNINAIPPETKGAHKKKKVGGKKSKK